MPNRAGVKAIRRGCTLNALSDGAFAWPDLLNRASHGREYVVGLGANQSDRAYDNHQNHSQHHGVLRDVLPILCNPESPYACHHGPPPGYGLSGISLCLKRLVSRQIAGAHTLNAASDGAFTVTRMTDCAVTMAHSAPFSGFVGAVRQASLIRLLPMSRYENGTLGWFMRFGLNRKSCRSPLG